MPRYKIHFEDGSEAGEAVYAMRIKPGDVSIAAGTQRIRVLDLVIVERRTRRTSGCCASSRRL